MTTTTASNSQTNSRSAFDYLADFPPVREVEFIEWMEAGTAFAIARKTERDFDRAALCGINMVRHCARSSNRTADEARAAARFVIWASLGCLYESAKLAAILDGMTDAAIKAAVLH